MFHSMPLAQPKLMTIYFLHIRLLYKPTLKSKVDHIECTFNRSALRKTEGSVAMGPATTASSSYHLLTCYASLRVQDPSQAWTG